MNLEVGETGVMKFDKGTSKVVITAIDSGYSGTDVWFDYQDGETYKPLIHEKYEVLPKSIIKSPIVIPMGILNKIFKKD